MRQLSRVTRAARLCGLTFSVLLLTLTCSAVARAQAGRSATRTWVSAAAGSSTNPCTRDAPCRELSAAVAAVAEDGEVVIIDSGAYDAVEITKSVQIVAPEGVHAVIAPTTGIAVPGEPNGATTVVLVNAPGARVVLRNITVNSYGAINSTIRVTAVGTLHVENCVLNVVNDVEHEELSDTGIHFATVGRLAVRDTTVRNHGVGILVLGPTEGIAYASVDRCRLDGNQTGVLLFSNSRATVSNTVATSGTGTGFHAYGAASELSCDNCVASNMHFGFRTTGMGAVMRVARSVATNNNYGFINKGYNAQFKSLAGTNMVDGNTTNRSGQITTVSPDAP